MTPAVRRMLREHGLTPVQIVGTGHGGRITREDVMTFVERGRTGGGAAVRGTAAPAAQAVSSPTPAWAPPAGLPTTAPAPAPSAPVVWAPGQDEELISLNQMRRGIAAQMTRAAAVPTAYSTFECDMTAVALDPHSRTLTLPCAPNDREGALWSRGAAEAGRRATRTNPRYRRRRRMGAASGFGPGAI